MKYLVFIFTFFSFFSVYGKSNDSPNLNYKSKNKLSWDEWIIDLKKDLTDENFKKITISYLDNLKFNKKVIELDRKQPEFKLNFNQYLKRYLTTKNKKKIKKKIYRKQRIVR